MGKSIKTGIAAAAMCLTFVGCQKYDFTPISDGEAAYVNYENAFIEKFGEPAPDQTWGFGSTEGNATKAATRAMTSSYTFPSAPYSSLIDDTSRDKYLSEVPAGVENYNNINGGNGYSAANVTSSYIEGRTSINIYSGWDGSKNIVGGTLYVKGYNDLTSGFNTVGQMEIYILEGATLKIQSGFQNECKIYIAKDATLEVTGNIDIAGCEIYNHGTIKANNMYIKANNSIPGLVYNANTITIDNNAGIIQTTNSKLYNLGTITSGNVDINSNGLVYNAGKLITNSLKNSNNGAELVNCANCAIETQTLEVTNKSLVYNSGNIKVKGAISGTNGESVIVNDGTLTGASLNTAGSSKVQNNGTATISGETKINSNNNAWVNNGQYTTGSFAYTAGSYDVINKCKLTVNGEFLINFGDCGSDKGFFMDGGSSVVAKTFKAEGPFYIHMGGKSVFEVTETAMFDASKADYGVYGIGTDYAVFHANKIEKGKDNQGYEVTYGGSLYVVANTTHFENGLSGTNPYIDFKNGCSKANIYQSGKTPHITIPTTECNPGFTGKLRIIAEDLPASVGDFDFNDVVFDVQLNWPETGKHTITLQAAGGTLPLYIGEPTEEHEVHKLFGVETGKMVNTEEWTEHKAPVTFVIEGNYTNANEIPVRVKKGNDLPLLTAETGKVPSKLAVPVTYKWCKELKDIEKVYTKLKDYVSDPTVIWYEPTPTENVYNK